MTAAPSMAEVLAGALRAQGLTDEPEKFDSDIHGWRCSHPDIYGRCDCFAETVRDLAQALADAGFGHVASVERERDEERRRADSNWDALVVYVRCAETAESKVAAVRDVLAEHWDWKAGRALHAAVLAALDGEGGR